MCKTICSKKRLIKILPNLVKRIARRTLLTLGKILIFIFDRKREDSTQKCLSNIEKILVIRLDRIGDMVHSLPTLRELKYNFPSASIDVLCTPYNYPVVEGSQYVNEVLLYEKRAPLKDKIALIKRLKAKAYSMALDLEDYSLLPAVLSYLTGARLRVGYDDRGILKREGRGFLFNYPVVPDRKTYEKYYVEQCLDLLRALNLKVRSSELEKISINKDDREYINGILLTNKIFTNDFLVGIHPGKIKSEPVRQWRKEGYASIIDSIGKNYHTKIVLMGSDEDERFVRDIVDLIHYPIINLAGKTTVKQLVALLERCILLICHDSGSLHIAVAQGVPTVCIVGPGSLTRWHEISEMHMVVHKGLSCSPCNSRECPYDEYFCITTITVDEVWNAVRKMMDKIYVQAAI